MSVNFVQANGQSIHYSDTGSGPTVVLVMGIGYDSTFWMNQVPAFSEQYRVITFDNRDAGQSSLASGDYEISDMAHDLVGVLDALEIDNAHVLGLSMGGMIAQQLAVEHPDRVNRLVLTGTGAAPARDVFNPISVWDWVRRNDPSGEIVAAQQFTWVFSTDFVRNQEACQQVLEMLESNPNPVGPEAFARQAHAYLEFDVLDSLDQIISPTLVIAGERDRLTPPWICQEVADAIPGSQLHVIQGPGASHALPLERPEEFNKITLDFLAEDDQ